MKTNYLLIVMCALFTFSMMSLDVNAQKNKSKGKETVTFYVDEMECKNCQAKVEKNIAYEKGVTDLKCDLKTKTVEVTYKTDKATPESLIAGFNKIGMTAVVVDSVKLEPDFK